MSPKGLQDLLQDGEAVMGGEAGSSEGERGVGAEDVNQDVGEGRRVMGECALEGYLPGKENLVS